MGYDDDIIDEGRIVLYCKTLVGKPQLGRGMRIQISMAF